MFTLATPVSECYVSKVLAPLSNAEVLYGLDMAALEGLSKASYWYNRVCVISLSPEVVNKTEFQPSTVVESGRYIPPSHNLRARDGAKRTI